MKNAGRKEKRTSEKGDHSQEAVTPTEIHIKARIGRDMIVAEVGQMKGGPITKTIVVILTALASREDAEMEARMDLQEVIGVTVKAILIFVAREMATINKATINKEEVVSSAMENTEMETAAPGGAAVDSLVDADAAHRVDGSTLIKIRVFKTRVQWGCLGTGKLQ